MEQRWEGGSGEEAEEQGGTPGSQDEDSQDSQWRTSTGEEDALPARRRRLRRQRAPRDNVVRCKSGYDGPGTAACSKDAAQGDAAAASADAIWPSDSDITVIRVRRHCAANLRAARSRRSGSACGSDASSGGGGGSGACGAGATGGGGACSCEGLLHPVDNPSMVNFATLVREGQRGAWRRRRHQREQLVPLSSWGPPGGRRWPRSAHAASTVTQPQSARPPQCTESASRQHYVVRGSGGPCSRQVASASAGRPTHLLDLSLPPPTSQRDVAVIFAQQHWVPDSSVSATSSEFPDASLVLAGVAGEGAGATTAAAAAAVASTMTVAMPHPRTSIPDAHGTPRSSSARTHQPRHYHHYHHHHHHHHHHHRRRQVSRDGKEAPAACDVTERRGLRALLRAVAAACAGRHSRYK